jgi:hypothetical protein
MRGGMIALRKEPKEKYVINSILATLVTTGFFSCRYSAAQSRHLAQVYHLIWPLSSNFLGFFEFVLRLAAGFYSVGCCGTLFHKELNEYIGGFKGACNKSHFIFSSFLSFLYVFLLCFLCLYMPHIWGELLITEYYCLLYCFYSVGRGFLGGRKAGRFGR